MNGHTPRHAAAPPRTVPLRIVQADEREPELEKIPSGTFPTRPAREPIPHTPEPPFEAALALLIVGALLALGLGDVLPAAVVLTFYGLVVVGAVVLVARGGRR